MTKFPKMLLLCVFCCHAPWLGTVQQRGMLGKAVNEDTFILSPRDRPRIWLYSLPIYTGRILKSLLQKHRPSITLLLELGEYVYLSRCFPCEACHISYQFLLSLLFMSLLPSKGRCTGCLSDNWEMPCVRGISSHFYAVKHQDGLKLCIARSWCERTYVLMQINVISFLVLAAPLHLSGHLCHS